MRVRIVQQAPVPRAVAKNIEMTADAVFEARRSDLVVLPELFLSGYQLERLEEVSLSADSSALDPIRDAAARMQTAVIVGFAETHDRATANSAICIGPDGRTSGMYRKTHLFGAECDVFAAGDSLEPIHLCGRRIGLMICFDVEFPEVARTLAARDADLLVTISANMVPYARDHASFTEARALENGLPHIYANRTGSESGFTFVGGSRAIDETAAFVGKLDAVPSVLDVEIGDSRSREHLVYREQLRSNLYFYGEAARTGQ